MYLFDTGLSWLNPSPNMRSLEAALLYPGIGMLEFTNVSVGRGTDTPFEVMGAPWIDERELAEMVNAANPPGVRVVPLRFTPTASKFANEECHGIHFVITDWEKFRSFDLGLIVAHCARANCIATNGSPRGTCDCWAMKRCIAVSWPATTWQRFSQSIEKDLERFRERKKEFEIYE